MSRATNHTELKSASQAIRKDESRAKFLEEAMEAPSWMGVYEHKSS